MKYINLLLLALVTTQAIANEDKSIGIDIVDESHIEISDIEIELNEIREAVESIRYLNESNTQNIRNIKNKIDVSEMVNVNLNKLQSQYDDQNELSESLYSLLNDQAKQTEERKLEFELLQSNILTLKKRLKYFNEQLSNGEEALHTLNSEVSNRINEVHENTSTMVSDATDVYSNKFLYVGIGFGFVLVFFLSGVLVLRRKMATEGVTMERKITAAKDSLEAQSLSLDSKLLEVLEKQLIVEKEQHTQVTASEDIDHTLSLRVADEITRMQHNISKMDVSTKGLKPLTKGLERLRKNFSAEGYEIVDLLNKPYDTRMNIDVINFINDESLEEDQSVIVKVVRPQVNYSGVLIQRAQINVATR